MVGCLTGPLQTGWCWPVSALPRISSDHDRQDWSPQHIATLYTAHSIYSRVPDPLKVKLARGAVAYFIFATNLPQLASLMSTISKPWVPNEGGGGGGMHPPNILNYLNFR